MPKYFELRQEHTALLDKSSEILSRAEAAGREMTPDERTIFDGYKQSAEKLRTQIESISAENTHVQPKLGLFGTPRRAELPQSSPAPTSLTVALHSASAEDVEQVRSFANYLGGDMEALANLVPTGDGGVFIPTIIAGVVARNYSAFSPVRDNATVWPTQGGEPTTFPVISDSESATILAPSALTGLDDVVSGDTPPTAITGPLMGAYKFSSKPVFIPRETITDASLNVMEEILSALLARIARLRNIKHTKGSGSGEPRGFLTDATAYSAGSVALDLDIALDLAYSVPAMYRPDSCYMASDITVKYLRKLKTGLSGDKRALWENSFEEGNATQGTPPRLHGYPLVINNDMDSVASDGTFASVSPLAFGNFKRFVVREAEQGAPYIYRYSVPAKDGSAIIAFERSDSKLLVATAISKLTV